MVHGGVDCEFIEFSYSLLANLGITSERLQPHRSDWWSPCPDRTRRINVLLSIYF